MVSQIILADILLVARVNYVTTQLVKYPRVLSVKPSNKVYRFYLQCNVTSIYKSQFPDYISCK